MRSGVSSGGFDKSWRETYHEARRGQRLNKGACIVNTRSTALIAVRLREAIDRHNARSGKELTYRALAERTGLSRATIESLATRPGYNTSLRTIALLCQALGCSPGELLQLQAREPQTKPDRKG
jgi:putative transcriptional regulator